MQVIPCDTQSLLRNLTQEQGAVHGIPPLRNAVGVGGQQVVYYIRLHGIIPRHDTTVRSAAIGQNFRHPTPPLCAASLDVDISQKASCYQNVGHHVEDNKNTAKVMLRLAVYSYNSASSGNNGGICSAHTIACSAHASVLILPFHPR